MKIGDIRTPQVVVTHPNHPLAEAAWLMRRNNVGALVVLDEGDPKRRPQGILTDRDIIRGQVLKGADLHCLTVADVMSRDPVSLRSDMSLAEGVGAMKARAVRRAPVVDADGSLCGIVTLDNLLPAVACELQELARILGAQAQRKS